MSDAGLYKNFYSPFNFMTRGTFEALIQPTQILPILFVLVRELLLTTLAGYSNFQLPLFENALTHQICFSPFPSSLLVEYVVPPVFSGGGRRFKCNRKTANVSFTAYQRLQKKFANVYVMRKLHYPISYSMYGISFGDRQKRI
jgi:hypothetical protein